MKKPKKIHSKRLKEMWKREKRGLKQDRARQSQEPWEVYYRKHKKDVI